MIKYVVGFMFNELADVALIKKNKPEWQKGLFNGIGGKIENDESPTAAMVREFKEETGVETIDQDWNHIITMNFDNCILYVFKSLHELDNIKTMEEEEVMIFNINNLPLNKMIDNLHWIIPFCVYDGCEHVIEINYNY